MKAITLWPEFYFPLVYLGMRVDNRKWMAPRTLWGQRVAIHMGVRYKGINTKCLPRYYADIVQRASRVGHDLRPWYDRTELCPRWKGFYIRRKGGSRIAVDVHRLPTRAIVGTVIVRGSSFLYAGASEYCDGTTVTPWSLPGTYGWQLENLVLLDQPIPQDGSRGVWTVPEDIERALRVTQNGSSFGQCGIIGRLS